MENLLFVDTFSFKSQVAALQHQIEAVHRTTFDFGITFQVQEILSSATNFHNNTGHRWCEVSVVLFS
jgi:hypothetical protein